MQRQEDRVRPLKANGFTLVELLIVLAALGLLAAILVPVLARSRESARQASCLNNLRQLGSAVRLYYGDETHYPATLSDLVPPDVALVASTGGGLPDLRPSGEPGGGESPAPENKAESNTAAGGGYLRSIEALRCPDDATAPESLRSSYGEFMAENISARIAEPLVWNYYGYKADGLALSTPVEAAQAASTSGGAALLINPARPYDAHSNPIARSLSNRFAPPDAIITHCRFHRVPTSALHDPDHLYQDAGSSGARDALLHVDGSARVVDVSGFKASGAWQKP